MKESDVIKGCKKFRQSAQKKLYDKYHTILRGVCIRYCSTHADVEDVLQDSFVKIITSIRKFEWKGDGSLQAWMIRVTINTALSHNRKQSKVNNESIDDHLLADESEVDEADEISSMSEKELLKKEPDVSLIQKAELTREEMLEVLNEVPLKYREVFNLYVIDGLKHKEISELLGLAERGSRTRLMRARKLVQQELYRKSIEKLKQGKCQRN